MYLTAGMVVSKSFSKEQGVSPPPAKRKTKEAEHAAYEQQKQAILVSFKRKTLTQE